MQSNLRKGTFLFALESKAILILCENTNKQNSKFFLKKRARDVPSSSVPNQLGPDTRLTWFHTFSFESLKNLDSDKHKDKQTNKIQERSERCSLSERPNPTGADTRLTCSFAQNALQSQARTTVMAVIARAMMMKLQKWAHHCLSTYHSKQINSVM